MTVTCLNGHTNPEGQNFCGVCGAVLQADAVPEPPPSKGKGSRPKIVVAAIASVVAIAGIAAAVVVLSQSDDDTNDTGATDAPADISVDSTRFELAHTGCGVTSTDIDVADEGDSIIMDGPPDGSNGLSVFIEDAFCILGALEVPEFVIHNIENTTSLMGLQEAEWDGIHAQWSYHPDNGMDLVLTETQQ